ncbi:SRPBCC family protein [Roseateles sp.]|uniref:SRPBCC family protein n=1 Tax=Roseateles sp. TaxID=1971397 RepID=UPI003BAA6800
MNDLPPSPERPKVRLPFSRVWPLAVGVAFGLAARGLAEAHLPFGLYPMMFSFIGIVPFAVGAVTVYVAERSERHTVGYHFRSGFLANVFLVLGTLAILWEGLICAILIVPLLALVGGIGGLAMGWICRATRWPRASVSAFAALPLLAAGIEAPLPLPDRFGNLQGERFVAASPEQVWAQLMDMPAIGPEEMADGWMYRIGVPLPLSGVTQQDGKTLVRHVEMGRGIRFDQVSTDWQPAQRVRWTYRFSADSFPPRAMDDHVRIGGRHFDLIDTVYTLQPEGAGTRLRVAMSYRVTTQFNWYAEPLARWLIGDFEAVALRLYARRAEALAHRQLQGRAT